MGRTNNECNVEESRTEKLRRVETNSPAPEDFWRIWNPFSTRGKRPLYDCEWRGKLSAMNWREKDKD